MVKLIYFVKGVEHEEWFVDKKAINSRMEELGYYTGIEEEVEKHIEYYKQNTGGNP